MSGSAGAGDAHGAGAPGPSPQERAAPGDAAGDGPKAALDRFVRTGAIDEELIALVAGDVEALRADLDAQPGLSTPGRAALAMAAAQLRSLLAYLRVRGPRGLQADWQARATRPDAPSLGPPIAVDGADSLRLAVAEEDQRHAHHSPQEQAAVQGRGNAAERLAAAVEQFTGRIRVDPDLNGCLSNLDPSEAQSVLRGWFFLALRSDVGSSDHLLWEYEARQVSGENFDRIAGHLVRTLSEDGTDALGLGVAVRNLGWLRACITGE
jgi:hypothetical protein